MAFNDRLRDYIQVNERIMKFYETYENGSLQSELVRMDDKLVIVKAWAYRTPDDPRPGVGYSSMEIPGSTSFTKGSELENTETSAWGRALAALGFEVKRGIASKEEVQNKSGADDFLNGSQVAGADSVRSPLAEPAPAALITPEQCGMVFEQFATFYNAAGHSKMSDEAIQKFGPVETWKAADFDARFAKIKKAVAKVVPDEDIKF